MYELGVVLMSLYVILKWAKVCFEMRTKFLCVVNNVLFVLVFLSLLSCFPDVLSFDNATLFGLKFVCVMFFLKFCVVIDFVFVLMVLL